MNLDKAKKSLHQNSGEDQKKGLQKNWNTFFPRIQVPTCARMHTRVKLLEGMQIKTILNLLGGIQSNYWGVYFPHPPRVSAPLHVAFLYLRVMFKFIFLSLAAFKLYTN